MGTQGVHLTRVLPWFVELVMTLQEIFLACLGCSVVGPVQDVSFLTGNYFTRFVPIARQAGQAVGP
jgi:hypothetical protein